MRNDYTSLRAIADLHQSEDIQVQSIAVICRYEFAPVLYLVKTMTYQTQLRPWCIVRQLPEMPSTIVDRFRRYHDADARVQFLRQQTPSQRFSVVFETESNSAAKPAH